MCNLRKQNSVKLTHTLISHRLWQLPFRVTLFKKLIAVEIADKKSLRVIHKWLKLVAESNDQYFLLIVSCFFGSKIFVCLLNDPINGIFNQSLHLALRHDVFKLVAQDFVTQGDRKTSNFVGS